MNVSRKSKLIKLETQWAEPVSLTIHSALRKLNTSKLGRKHPWKVIYKDCSFSSDPSINMAATGHSCF
jgi:hypothetical protein